MTSKSSRKPCQVDVKIDSNLDSEVSVVSAFIVAGVDGSIGDVGIDSSADIHVSGVGHELGVVRVSVDVGAGGNIDEVGLDGSLGIQVNRVGCELGVVRASVDVGVDGNIDDVGIDGSPGIRVNRVGCELSVGGNLVVGDNSVGGHIVAAWFVLKVPLCVGSIIEDPVVEFAIWDGHLEACVGSIFGVCSMKDFSSLFSTTPSKLDKDVELDILVLWWDGVIYVGLRKFFREGSKKKV